MDAIMNKFITLIDEHDYIAHVDIDMIVAIYPCCVSFKPKGESMRTDWFMLQLMAGENIGPYSFAKEGQAWPDFIDLVCLDPGSEVRG
jgi:hypothetical protein